MANLEERLEDLKRSAERLLAVDDATLNVLYREGQESYPFNVDLIKFYMDKLKEWFPNKDFGLKVSFETKPETLIETDKCKVLEQVDNFLRENNTNLFITEGINQFDFRETMEANRKLDIISNTIKKATMNVNGQEVPLSNFEKFMLAYEFVTDFVYKESNDDLFLSRHWVHIMEGDSIVCVGYSSLLTNLCDRIFDPGEVKIISQSSSVYDREDMKSLGSHQNNMIFIKDEKYGINGAYYVDACWDCKKKDQIKRSTHCCLPLNDIIYNKREFLNFGPSLLHFYLIQNPDYYEPFKDTESVVTKNKSLEDQVDDFLRSSKINDFYDEHLCNIIKHEGGGRFSTVMISNEEEKILKSNEKFHKQQIIEKYNDIFSKYPNLEIPMLNDAIIESANLEPHLDVIASPNPDEKQLEETIEYLGTAFNSEFIQDVMVPKCKQLGFKVRSLQDFVSDYVAYANYEENRKTLLEKKEKHIAYAKNKNMNNLINTINNWANVDPIPLEAYINSYKIIGENLGLSGEKLDQYVNERLERTFDSMDKLFDVKHCKNCFAVDKNRDLYLTGQKSR